MIDWGVLLSWMEEHPNIVVAVGGATITGIGSVMAWLATRKTDIMRLQNDAWSNLVKTYQTAVETLTGRIDECEEDRGRLWIEIRNLQAELRRLKTKNP